MRTQNRSIRETQRKKRNDGLCDENDDDGLKIRNNLLRDYFGVRKNRVLFYVRRRSWWWLYYETKRRLVSWFDVLDDGVEAGVFVGGVWYDSLWAVWFQKCVLAFNFVAVSCFPLALDVVRVQVVDSVVVVVVGGCLQQKDLSWKIAEISGFFSETDWKSCFMFLSKW